MASSPEYPDLTWVPPASWTNANRSSVQLIVIHTTEGSEGPTSAEDGAAYDARRTDGTSTHFFHDSNSTVQCVRTEDIAHAARHEGNLRGVQHELCGSAYQGSSGWADAVSQATLRQAAKQCARDAKKWNIPVRKLTVAQVADGVKGFCGHVEITYAFPQDNGTHTDPGPNFPWSTFLGMVQAEMEEPVPLDQNDLNNIRAVVDIALASKFDSATAIANEKARPWQYNGGGLPGFLPAGTGTLLYFSDLCNKVNTLLPEILAKVTDDDAEAEQIIATVNADMATLQAAVANVDEEVIAKLGDAGMTVAEKADLLRAVLGDDAAAVGALLAAG
jgi:hypothetical protein